MNYKNFPDVFWQKLNSTLSELKASGTELIAAFDADGTLWDTDLGENFFHYQIDSKKIDLPENPWQHYQNLKKVNHDPRQAYVWLAQINAGQTLRQVQDWSAEAFSQIEPNPIFSEQKKLIDLLLSQKVRIYIVTASIKWAVEPGARALGLTEENVIGVATLVHEGLVTNQPLFPITYQSGKVDALLKKTNLKKPFLCAGNSMGDFELLECATHMRLAVSAASRDDRLFKTESELLEKATSLQWWSHRFI